MQTTIDDTVWDVRAHRAPTAPGERRTMHGLPVLGCGIATRYDQYDPAAVHLPHRAPDGSAWCPGNNSRVNWAVATCLAVDADSRETGHGEHAHDERGGVLWCRGYRTSGPVVWAGSESATGDDQRADQRADAEHDQRMRAGDGIIDAADRAMGWFSRD